MRLLLLLGIASAIAFNSYTINLVLRNYNDPTYNVTIQTIDKSGNIDTTFKLPGLITDLGPGSYAQQESGYKTPDKYPNGYQIWNPLHAMVWFKDQDGNLVRSATITLGSDGYSVAADNADIVNTGRCNSSKLVFKNAPATLKIEMRQQHSADLLTLIPILSCEFS